MQMFCDRLEGDRTQAQLTEDPTLDGLEVIHLFVTCGVGHSEVTILVMDVPDSIAMGLKRR